MPVTIERLKAVSYLKPENLGDGRVVNLMPLWDGSTWHQWFDLPDRLIDLKIVDVSEGDYIGKAAAKPSDLFIPFIDFMWQRASWPEITDLIVAIADDFHNMGTSVAKLRLVFDSRKKLSSVGASRFASTELEYLVMLCRTVFDVMQEMISIIWAKYVQLHDAEAEQQRKRGKLPDRFSNMVLIDKKRPRTAAEIEQKYGIPKPLAEEYAKIAPFFSRLRDVRDNVVHGRKGIGHVFDTERGFCVDPKRLPFSQFTGWRDDHRDNENIVSVLPWIADVILQTIDMCNRLMGAFAQVVAFPAEIAPGFRIFIRGPHNAALADVIAVHHGGSPWWEEKRNQPEGTE
ncbi:MAG: hypothetical protein WA672_14150 [Candidatus Angelobacter sp.]